MQHNSDPVSISAPTSWRASVVPSWVTAPMLTLRFGPYCCIAMGSPEMFKRCQLPSRARGSSSAVMMVTYIRIVCRTRLPHHRLRVSGREPAKEKIVLPSPLAVANAARRGAGTSGASHQLRRILPKTAAEGRNGPPSPSTVTKTDSKKYRVGGVIFHFHQSSQAGLVSDMATRIHFQVA